MLASNPPNVETDLTAATDSIEVSANTLKSLLSSMEQLRRDVSQLQNDNANLAAELQRLQESSGARFHRFSKLPTELRRMIWVEALTAPQVIVLHEHKISRSQVNFIMHTCREVRDVGLKLQLPYFQISSNLTWSPEDPKHYFNLDADTIWLEDDAFMPDCVQFFCGICPRGSLFPLISQKADDCSHNLRLKRLAINYKEWQDPERGGSYERQVVGTTDVLRHLNSVRELYIVVGDTTTSRQRDIFFQTPKRAPFRELNISLEHITLTWSRAESELEETFKIFKQDRADQRKLELEVNGRDEEELDEYGFMDISSWEPPKVRFVEAFTAQNWWIRP